MKKLLYIIPILIIVAVVIFKLKSNKEVAQAKVFHYDKDQPLIVTADTVKSQLVNTTSEYTGTFEPFKEGKVMAEVPGKILRLNYDVGSFIAAGAVVANLDKALLELQSQTTQVQIDGYMQDVKRFEILVKADAIQGVQLEKAELALRTAKLQKQQLQEQIRKATITAPFSGMVTQKFAELGTVVGPGTPLLQITDISRLKLTVNVAEADLQNFKMGNSLQVKADVLPGNSFTGKVTMVGSKADAAHNFAVQLLLTNPPGHPVKAGMYGILSLGETTNKKLIAIPLNAITGSAEKPQVYVVRNEKAILTNIVISKKIDNKAIIESGLSEGDVFVTGGFINLFDSANIKLSN